METLAFSKSLVSPASDVSLIRGATDLMTQQASVIPVVGVGQGWAYQPDIMDAGLLEERLLPYGNRSKSG